MCLIGARPKCVFVLKVVILLCDTNGHTTTSIVQVPGLEMLTLYLRPQFMCIPSQ